MSSEPSTNSSVHPLGVGLDPFSDELSQEPFDIWSTLRGECPVVRSEALGGFFLLSRYEDVRAATLDTSTFSSAEGTTVPPQPVGMPPEDTDPPVHRKYRDILNPPFAPKAIAANEPWMRQIARDLLDAIEDPTRFDFVAEFATPMPRRIILRMLGVPSEDMEIVSEPMEVLNSAYDDVERAAAAGGTLYGYFGDLIAARRDEPRREDLVSILLDATFDDRPLTDLEMQHMLILNLLGGTDTSTGAMGGMMLWLADHPEDADRLRAEPELAPIAVEEFLRYTSPVVYMARTATEDTTVEGCPIGAGDKVLLGFGPANHDEEKFPNAGEVVLDRRPNNHLAFGAGPHRCVGSHLVKAEMKIALEEVLARFSSFEVDDRSRIHYQRGQARNIRCLPLLTA